MNTLSPQKPIIVLSDIGLFLTYPKHNLLSSQNDYFIAFYGKRGWWGRGSRDGVVVTAFASHQCDPGFDSRTRRYHMSRVCC